MTLSTHRSFLALLALVWSGIAAAAGGTVTVEAADSDGGTVTLRLEFADAGRLRMASPQHPQAWLLMLDGTAYNVLQFGSTPIVVEAAEMLANAGAVGSLPVSPAGTDDIRKLIQLKATGKRETVGGVDGERYRLTYVDGEAHERDEQIVLTTDALIRDLSRAMYRLGSSMSQAAGIAPPEGSERLMQELEVKGLGLLRFGSRMRVTAVDRRPPDAGRFQLPAAPMSGLPSFGQSEFTNAPLPGFTPE